MKTLYGEIPNESLIVYVDGLVNKVYKTLPMKEEDSPTLSKYIQSLLRELVGEKELINEISICQDLISLIGVLQSLLNESDISIYKSDVFKAISLVKHMKVTLGGVK